MYMSVKNPLLTTYVINTENTVVKAVYEQFFKVVIGVAIARILVLLIFPHKICSGDF